ncbi:MAG: mechanosensitive ion channel family protein [Prolixibacteraceae bacterium]
MENLDQVMESAKAYISLYGLRLVGAIILLIIGIWVINIFVSKLRKGLMKKLNDASLVSFTVSFVGVLLKIMLIISIMSMIGIQMTSFIAILGAAGFAVGMAMSGTLQNFAGGVMVLIFKPFKVGDYIDAIGHAGTVKEIQIFNTILSTPDNRIIFVPNGKIYTESIVNYSHEPQRRVDFKFGVGYEVDYELAKKVLATIIEQNDLILSDPAPFIGLIELGDSSVNIVVRVWVESANYWSVFFKMNETVFKEFNQQGISIPYPQMDVHVKNNK